ncbi:hypothetical protein F5050DRAFT_562950 [Lentinula boryana]|uniref:C2H2-type domain-containing protein n=1 Tax=Lentinula boryana TaxID=40481 RepID=A0ABQ8QP54_9AGAR|nr:hypothetical protein F5050DRAFT_562950 [Lentinula boryana]
MARTRKPVFKADGTLKDPAVCDLCGTKVARKGDLPRHMRSHLSAEEKFSKSYACPYDGCTYRSLQKGNVDTHIRTHTKEKIKCPTCDFETPDPGSLTRHRKRRHEYVPEPRKPRNPGNGLPADCAQPQIIIETPSTYSCSASASPSHPAFVAAECSLDPTGVYESDATTSTTSSPLSYELALPDALNAGYESDAAQPTATSSAFSHELEPISAEYDCDVTSAMPTILATAYTLVNPSPVINTPCIGVPSEPPRKLRRTPLGLQDILSDESRVYWGRRV